MQRLSARQDAVDSSTVQGVIEFGLQKFLRIDQAALGICSRTDNGVHAIESAATFEYKGTV